MAGKTILITGGSAGIGLTTAEEAARAGASHIALLARNRKNALEAEKLIRKAGPSTNVSVITCDLDDFDSVREAASVLKGEGVAFDVVFLNAGAMMLPQGKTKQGLEQTIGSNHFAHFLLTKLIRETDLIKEKGRVVVLSSDAPFYWPDGFNIDDLHWTKRPYSTTGAYAASKLANILMAQELQNQFTAEGKGRIAVSVHPGVVRTRVVREPGMIRNIALLIYPLYWSATLSPLEGSQCSLYAATTSDDIAGKYLRKLRVSNVPKHVNDENARALWAISEKTIAESS